MHPTAIAPAGTDALIERALAEDLGEGDVTTDAIVAEARRASADLVVRERGVVCGLWLALAVVRRLDPSAAMVALADDGELVEDAPRAVATIDAATRALLAAERTALNIVQRMSGIATATRAYVDAVAGTGVEILDTRKTAPGLRTLDKSAVAAGGGRNHRQGLWDAVLVKDNHVAVAGGVGAAVAAVRAARPDLPVEVEVDDLDQLREALAAGAETILLDNMPPALLERAVAFVRASAAPSTRLEASGGITLDTVRAVAETGVDAISVGALTHSVRALDMALEVRL